MHVFLMNRMSRLFIVRLRRSTLLFIAGFSIRGLASHMLLGNGLIGLRTHSSPSVNLGRRVAVLGSGLAARSIYGQQWMWIQVG